MSGNVTFHSKLQALNDSGSDMSVEEDSAHRVSSEEPPSPPKIRPPDSAAPAPVTGSHAAVIPQRPPPPSQYTRPVAVSTIFSLQNYILIAKNQVLFISAQLDTISS